MLAQLIGSPTAAIHGKIGVVQRLLPEQNGSLSPAGVAEAHEWPEVETWVRALMVATADGAARSETGVSGGISSAGDRLIFGTIRGMSDAVLVGANTIRAEGYGGMKARPELVARRKAAGQNPAPRVAIITRSGDLDTSTGVFTDSDEPPIVFVPENLAEDKRADLSQAAEVIAAGKDDVVMTEVMAYLRSIGLPRIVCEGGPSLLGSLAAQGLLNELCLTVTPLLAGGSYPNGDRTPRILDGAVLPISPETLTLEHVLEDRGTLFLRYLVNGSKAGPQLAEV
jgi:riboflavin biosynthesis pyrimidine reductase